MRDRPAPRARLESSELERRLAGFGDLQLRDIALTLNDLSGWATLSGQVIQFDSTTGMRLAEPVKTVRYFDRDPRRHLPDDWIDLFITAGWLDTTTVSAGLTVWLPTAAGREIRDRWLPDHLQGGHPLP
ncbi:hypothetical protein ACI2LF_23980 [Kribbella sp. NPDC020789]